MSWWCLLCVEETACCTWYMPAASTDFHMDWIHCCPKLGFLCQHISMLLSLILSPPNNFTVKYWPDSIIYKTWLCVITLVSKQFMVISMSILPALDKVNRYSLQISIQGEEEWRGLMKVQIVTSNPCRKPTAEERLKTRFWFIAAARRLITLKYWLISVWVSLICVVMYLATCDRLCFGRGVASFWVHPVLISSLLPHNTHKITCSNYNDDIRPHYLHEFKVGWK